MFTAPDAHRVCMWDQRAGMGEGWMRGEGVWEWGGLEEGLGEGWDGREVWGKDGRVEGGGVGWEEEVGRLVGGRVWGRGGRVDGGWVGWEGGVRGGLGGRGWGRGGRVEGVGWEALEEGCRKVRQAGQDSVARQRTRADPSSSAHRDCHGFNSPVSCTAECFSQPNSINRPPRFSGGRRII